MTYQQHYAIFKVKHWGKPDNQLHWAINDCYNTLQVGGYTPQDEYGIKLWSEIDVIRDLFLLRDKRKA